MAWQILRASSEFCKRSKPSLKHRSRPSIFSRVSSGDHESLFSSVGKKDFSYGSGFSPCTHSSRVVKTQAGNSYNSSRRTDYATVWTNTWICGGLASKYHGHTALGIPSISGLTSRKTFSSASRSSSHHLEGIHDLQDVENGRGETVDADILHTEDGQVLYSGMRSTELLSTLLNLNLVAYEPLVDLSIKVLKSPLMRYAVYRQPVLAAVKRTAFSHFCAGDGIAEASKTLQRMWELGLKSILDYSLEDAMDNCSCDRNLTGFTQTINQTKQLPSGSIIFRGTSTAY